MDEGRQQGIDEGRRHGFDEGRQQGFDEARQQLRDDTHAHLQASDLAASERLLDGIRAIDRARSLSEILDTLASCAAREVRRAGVLIVQGGRVRGWRFLGFGAGFEDPTAIDVPAEKAGIVAEAIRTNASASSDVGAGATPSFMDVAAGREMLAVPLAMSGEVVAVLYADQGTEQEADASSPLNWPAALEVLTRHAARCLEAITAFRAAQTLSEGPRGHAATGGTSASDRPSQTPGNGQGEHDAARRYARLLVSEIKLYHEAAVIAGRRERDLSTRLGGEIARARVLYEQRVPLHVRRHTDHFHAELVRTLANGDPALLGQPI
jgi:hypothetical protein